MTRDEAQQRVNCLRGALGRLDKTQGRVARTNARRHVARELHKLRDWLDEEYPVIPKSSRKQPTKRTPEQRKRELEKRCYVEVDDYAIRHACLEARVPMKRVVEKTTLGAKRSTYYIPDWASAIGGNVAQLREARKSRTKQRALSSEVALDNG